MACSVWGVPLLTADMTGTSVSQAISPDSNVIVVGIRAWIIQNNNPSYTSINMKIYSNSGLDTPRALIATSTNSLTKSAMFGSSNSGLKEVCFLFDNVLLKASDTYHLVINGVSYTGDASSHLAWRKSFTEPVYRTNADTSYEGLAVSSLLVSVIGAKL